MQNMVRLTGHLAAHVARESLTEPERRVLSFVRTRDGATHHGEPDGEVWRLLPWVEGTRSTERAETRKRRGGGAGLWSLPAPARGPSRSAAPRDYTRLPRHPGAAAALERAVSADTAGRVRDAGPEIEALLDRRRLGQSLDDRVAAGELTLRPTHNDAKIAIVLFDTETGEPLCVVAWTR